MAPPGPLLSAAPACGPSLACMGQRRHRLCCPPLLDPMNALTNLTGVGGGPGAIGMGPRPPGAPVGVMGAMGPMQIGQHAMAGVAGNPQASECLCVCV